MKYSQIKRENELKEVRYSVLNALKELGIINIPEFKSYVTMIVKMYEWDYYDKYEHILEEIEENTLIEMIEIFIQGIDERGSANLNPNVYYLIKSIEVICIEKQYVELADSLLELEDIIE